MMTPETEVELAEMIKAAREPLSIRGGGTRGIAPEGVPLNAAKLSGVTLYEPGALTLVAQAGTPIAEIEEVLAKENQRLAFEPMDHRALLGTSGTPTLGGVIAGNISGPRRIQAGAARDFALGLRYVDGAGTIVKNGGRVMKNVTGYDLVKLLCGSWGTLGVISEISLKVLPCPETETSLVLPGLSPERGVAAMSAALGAPFEVSGAAYEGDAVLLRFEGFAASVAYRAEQVRMRLAQAGFGEAEVVSDAGASAARWAAIRDVVPLSEMQGDVWRVSVKPSDGPAVLAAAQAEGALMDWGGGLVWLCLPEGTDLRARLGDLPGHASLVRASAQTRKTLGSFAPEPPALLALAAGIRQRFDPRGVLNPGLMAA